MNVPAVHLLQTVGIQDRRPDGQAFRDQSAHGALPAVGTRCNGGAS